jgi:MFS family permease
MKMTTQAEFDREVMTNFRWNFTVNTLDISFYAFAGTLVSQATIMPLMVSQLTDSKIAIGLIPAIYSLGFLLPQLLTANYIETLPRKLPFLRVMGGTGERLPFFVIGLVLFWLAKPAPVLTLVLFFLLLGISAATNGLLNPAWYDMIAKVIPVQYRGIWSGVGNFLGAALGIAGGAVAGEILVAFPFPTNYAICFLLAGVAMAVSWAGLAMNREPASLVAKPVQGLGTYFKQLPGVLRRDHNYLRYLVGRSVANLGGMAAGFIMVYGVERFQMGGAAVGGLTMMLVAVQAVMNLAWGWLADRRGHKLVLAISAFGMAATTLVAWLASSPAWLWAAFALLGIATAADLVSNMNIILEFCAEEDRPTYIGLTNTLLAPAKALAPVIGGWLATVVGYQGMFPAALALAVLGGVLLAVWVREPRFHTPVNAQP